MDLKNPEQRKEIQNTLRQGMESEFWKIICQRLKEHLDSIQSVLDSDNLLTKSAEEYKIQSEVFKRQKRDRQGFMDMPEVMIHELDDPDFFGKREEEIYPVAEDFAKKA